MPFQAGSQNYELSFQGKCLHLGAVPVFSVWPVASMGEWE